MEWPPTTTAPALRATAAPPSMVRASSSNGAPPGPAHQVEAHDRPGPHGVDVGEGVGGGDPSEVVGVVDDGGEEVGGEDDGQVVADPVDGGVVGGVEPDEEVRVGRRVEALHEAQHRPQFRRRQLAGAAGAVGVAGEADLLGDGRRLEHELDGSERPVHPGGGNAPARVLPTLLRSHAARMARLWDRKSLGRGRPQAGQSVTVKPAGPDSVEPPGPVAVARTVPEPWSGPKAPPLKVADHRLPEPLA